MSIYKLTLTISCLFIAILACNGRGCDYYFKYHEDLGLSVYSGHIFESFEVFDVGVGVPVPLHFVYSGNELVNYVEGYNSTHALLTLGLGMLLNHNENPSKINIRKYLSEDPPLLTFPSNHEPSIDIRFEYSASISRGDQLFVHYGEEWFDERGMTMLDTTKHLTDTDSSSPKIPGCIKEYASLREGKLVAKRDVREGVTVETVRAIFLPATSTLVNYRGPFADILWWVKHFPSSTASVTAAGDATVSASSSSTQDFSHALLLSGYGAFFGMRTGKEGETSNVEARWDYEVPGRLTSEVLPRLLKFVATRPIQKGEELIVGNVQSDTHDTSYSRRVMVK